MATITFPIQGLHVGYPTGRTKQNTSRDMNNIRPIWDGMLIGGQRPAQDKWSDTQIGAAEQPIVAMAVVSSVV